MNDRQHFFGNMVPFDRAAWSARASFVTTAGYPAFESAPQGEADGVCATLADRTDGISHRLRRRGNSYAGVGLDLLQPR